MKVEIYSAKFSFLMYILKRVRVIVLNTIFNNISVILWRSILLVEETKVPGVSNRPATSQTNFIT